VWSVPAEGVGLEELDEAVGAIIEELGRTPVAADDLARAKTRLIADAVYAQDNQSTLARWYGAALASGETVEAIQQWPDRIDAVTAEDVRAAAAKWLAPERAVTGFLKAKTPAVPPQAA
ncbi:MAG TPA: insulinase family protein, partial [Beijerinckiaceae bacterium]